jgi:hypothetical protein
MSKFLNLIKEYKELLSEDNFVKPNEGSELPDATGDDFSANVEPSPEPSNDADFETPDKTSEQSFSDREIDLLNIALQLYRNNPQNDISRKNEFSELFKSEEYEDLLRELLSIADGYEI